VVPQSLRSNPSVRDYTPYTCMLVDRVMRRAHEFDILHFHIDFFHFPFARMTAPRTVTTLHGRLDSPDLHAFYRVFPRLPLVSISDAQRGPMPPVNWQATILHGLPPDLLRFHPKPDEYFAFLGRMSPEKRPDRAIQIAQRSGVKLKMAAKVDRADQQYFKSEIEPFLHDPLIEFVGEVGGEAKGRFLGLARALLLPIDWPEPFGLVMIEAMACGTPVIAFNQGSVPEVQEDGVTGFIVSSVEEAVAAAARVDTLDRALIRQRFEERFTADRMARDYVGVYEKLLSTNDAAKVA